MKNRERLEKEGKRREELTRIQGEIDARKEEAIRKWNPQRDEDGKIAVAE